MSRSEEIAGKKSKTEDWGKKERLETFCQQIHVKQKQCLLRKSGV
jgi:hypothetical protein